MSEFKMAVFELVYDGWTPDQIAEFSRKCATESIEELNQALADIRKEQKPQEPNM